MIEFHAGATLPHLLVDEHGMTVLREQFGPAARTENRAVTLTTNPAWAGIDIYIGRCPCEVTS